MTQSLALIPGTEASPELENMRRCRERRHRNGKTHLGCAGFEASEVKGDSREVAAHAVSSMQGRSGLKLPTLALSEHHLGWIE